MSSANRDSGMVMVDERASGRGSLGWDDEGQLQELAAGRWTVSEGTAAGGEVPSGQTMWIHQAWISCTPTPHQIVPVWNF